MKKVVDEGVRRFGRLDVVVANAGTMRGGHMWELTEEQWQLVIDVNLTTRTATGVDRLGIDQGVRDRREVGLRRRDGEVLRHVAVHLDGAHVPAERAAALAGEAALAVAAPVARGHRRQTSRTR